MVSSSTRLSLIPSAFMNPFCPSNKPTVVRADGNRPGGSQWGKMGKNGEKWGKNFMGKAF